MQSISTPPTRRSRTRTLRVMGFALLLAGVVALVPLQRGTPAARGATPATVSWSKVPGTITATLTAPDQAFTFDEVMTNQADPAGLGGFTFTVRYDAATWQAPLIDMTPAVDLFAAAGRILSCWPVQMSPGIANTACASNGTYGSGPVWSGPEKLATVTLRLLPNVAAAVLQGGGVQSTILDSGVQVTNSCGQPLNDGTIQPLPGQPECQGNLLPGLSGAGVVISPGSTTITITSPTATPTRTGTATPTHTPTRTATPQASSTSTAAASATRSPTASASRTATPQGTSTVPSASSTSHPGGTASPAATPSVPAGTRTAIAASTTATANHGGQTATASASAHTPVPTATARPCGFDANTWSEHPETWPVSRLALGHESYSSEELRSLLTSQRPDAVAVLVRELIAAKLNLAAYGDQGGASQRAVTGDEILVRVGGRLPDVAPEDYESQGMLWTAAALAQYNRDCARISAVLSSTTGSNGGGSPGLPRTGVSTGGGKHSWLPVLISVVCMFAAVLAAMFVRHAWDNDEN